MKRSLLVLVAVALLAGPGTKLYSQERSVRSRAEEMLEWWNQIANRLIAMAKDFPEDKYDSSCRKTNVPLHKIFYTSRQWITI
jgi:hypothetical protein